MQMRENFYFRNWLPPFLVLSSLICLVLQSCGNRKTLAMLQDKYWKVTDVTPPARGNFDIEDQNQADELKQGVYRNAWFEFTGNGTFKASFDGKLDSGKYKLGANGRIISLYPLHADTVYEQIQIQRLDDHELDFNTLIARFYMTLHCQAIPNP
jgi:hypothetical protein